MLTPGLGALGLGVGLYVLGRHRIPRIGIIEACLYRAVKARFVRRCLLRADRITMMSRRCHAPKHLLVQQAFGRDMELPVQGLNHPYGQRAFARQNLVDAVFAPNGGD